MNAKNKNKTVICLMKNTTILKLDSFHQQRMPAAGLVSISKLLLLFSIMLHTCDSSPPQIRPCVKLQCRAFNCNYTLHIRTHSQLYNSTNDWWHRIWLTKCINISVQTTLSNVYSVLRALSRTHMILYIVQLTCTIALAVALSSHHN